MLAIRMQRVGRKGHAQFRMVVQDSRFHPTSSRVVAYLGSYDPHSKRSKFDKEKVESYLANGAQPSPRVIKLLKGEKVKLPEWVREPTAKQKAVRNPEKRRSTRPEGVPEPQAEPQAEGTPATEEPVETAAEPESPAETPEAAKSDTDESKPEDEEPAEASEKPAE